MKLGDYFKQAIKAGDWDKVCKVYTQITGEKIAPPVVKLADMDMGDDEAATPASPADLDMPSDEEEGEDEEEEESPSVEQAQPPPAKNTVTEDFRVVRETSSGQSDSTRAARKESMQLPRQRKNRFADDQKIHAKELVTEHPELGVRNPRPRGDRSLIEGATDTSKTIEVVCSLCGTPDKVSEQLAVGWYKDPPGTREQDMQNTYKCNECQTPKGRAKLLRKQRQTGGLTTRKR